MAYGPSWMILDDHCGDNLLAYSGMGLARLALVRATGRDCVEGGLTIRCFALTMILCRSLKFLHVAAIPGGASQEDDQWTHTGAFDLRYTC